MWFDISANIGHWPFKKLEYNTCSALLERMDRFGVQLSAISNLNGVFYKNTQSANEELIEELNSDKRFAKRFVPFAIINPIYAGWRHDLEVCHEKLKMKGVRLYPLYHDYEINDPACIELVKSCRDRRLPVAFTTRIVDSRQRSWMDITAEWSLADIMPVIREVPDAKYLILNVANSMRLSGEDAELMKRTDFLIDTSGRSITNLGDLLKIYGREKFAFGTHSPILDYLTGMLRIDSLRKSEADEETKEMLKSKNALEFIGI